MWSVCLTTVRVAALATVVAAAVTERVAVTVAVAVAVAVTVTVTVPAVVLNQVRKHRFNYVDHVGNKIQLNLCC